MEQKKTILTYAGLKKLEDELHDLKVNKRREIAGKIKEAREQGDLSENAEYDAAKDEQRDIEARIEEIEKILKNAEVVVEDEVDSDKIMLIYTLHGNRLHALTKVVIPSCIPAIISTMKVNIGLCLVGVIIGEFIGGREGLGYMIIYGSQVFKLDWLLMSICILCVIAMLLYALIGLVEKWYLGRCKISG